MMSKHQPVIDDLKRLSTTMREAGKVINPRTFVGKPGGGSVKKLSDTESSSLTFEPYACTRSYAALLPSEAPASDFISLDGLLDSAVPSI